VTELQASAPETATTASVPFWLLVALTASGPLSTQIVAPALPMMAQAYGASYGAVGLSLSVFLWGLAFGQVVCGPLSDRYGRRPIVLAGLCLFAAGGMVTFFAQTVDVLLAGRALQALGASAGIPLARAVLRDSHGPDRTTSLLGYLKAAMVLIPMIAPLAGAWLAGAGGLPAVWGSLTGFAALLLLAAFVFQRETLQEKAVDARLRAIPSDYLALLSSRRFCGYSLQVAFSSAAFFALLGGGAFVITQLHGGERSDVGFWLMVVSSGYLVGNLATGFLASRVSPDRLLGVGVLWAVVVVGVIMVLALTGRLTVPLLFVLAGVMSLGHELCIPAGFAGAIGFDIRRAGPASGLTGFLQMALGGLVAALMGYLLSDSLLLLTLAMMACTTAAWLVSRFRGPQEPEPSVATAID
jgi:DHA1 family bicyclomycin/chloramphenicol resistance-like MFS transporter